MNDYSPRTIKALSRAILAGCTNLLNQIIMRPSYIILTESGERFDLNKANEFNPNEYDLSYEFQDRKIGFYFTSLYPNESYCYTPDIEGADEPITATTLGFKAYDADGNLICEDEGGCGIWL